MYWNIKKADTYSLYSPLQLNENDFISGFTQKNYEEAVNIIKNYNNYDRCIVSTKI